MCSDGFEEQSGFFEGSGCQNGDSQEKSEQDDEIHGHEEHRILRTRRAFWWPRLTSSRSDRLQATRADWCEGAYLATAGRTGNRCHPRSESLSSISIAGLRQRKTKRIGSSVAAWTSQKYRGVSHWIGSSQVTDKADMWMSERDWLDKAAPRLPSPRGHIRCKRVGSFCALPARHLDDGDEPSRSRSQLRLTHRHCSSWRKKAIGSSRAPRA